MNQLFCLILLLFSGSSQLRAAWVSGVMKNGAAGEAISIEVPQLYLDNRILHFHTTLDGQSAFRIQADIPEPGLVFLVYNSERLPLFLSADDTLLVKSDVFQFPVVVSFGGKSGADNRLLQAYLKQNQLDFNEFNNIRYKIGQTWITLEDPINGNMESLPPDLFRSSMDAVKATSIALIDEFTAREPNMVSQAFYDWLNADITYYWAYHLLAYGQIFGVRHGVQPAFFDFIQDAPLVSEQISSHWYQQFLLAFMARQQLKNGQPGSYWSGQYYLAEKYLAGKSLAYFRSEMIATAFSAERFHEILPLYNHFLQKNPFPVFDGKVEGLYQKFSRVSPGAPAPDFTAVDNHGNQVSLSQFRGKIVYLNFWASWCGACLRKMEFFDAFESELSTRGIEIVNISIDEDPVNWQKALSEHVYKGVQLLGGSGTAKSVGALYGVEAIPTYFIIDANGLFGMRATGNQPNDIRQQLLDLRARQK